MKWIRKCGKSRGWMRSVHGLSPEFSVYLFLCFLEWQVGKSLFVSEAFPKPLLPSSRFWECQQCLLGLVPQHDSWHGWCSAHCWNSEKSTRQLPHFCFCLLTTLQGFELAGLLVCLPVQTCGGKQGGALEAPLVFTLWRCFGIFSVHCVECFPVGRIFLQENLRLLGNTEMYGGTPCFSETAFAVPFWAQHPGNELVCLWAEAGGVRVAAVQVVSCVEILATAFLISLELPIHTFQVEKLKCKLEDFSTSSEPRSSVDTAGCCCKQFLQEQCWEQRIIV